MAKVEKARARHGYRMALEIPGPKGTTKLTEFTAWAETRYAQRRAKMMLSGAHVRSAIECHGGCDSSKCAVTQAMRDPDNHEGLKGAIPRSFLNDPSFAAFVDTNDSRIYISTKCSENGVPKKNIAFALGAQGAEIVKINDYSLAAQKKLAERLERDGPIEITLLPIKIAAPRPGRARGKTTGVREPVASKRRTARLPMYQTRASAA